MPLARASLVIAGLSLPAASARLGEASATITAMAQPTIRMWGLLLVFSPGAPMHGRRLWVKRSPPVRGCGAGRGAKPSGDAGAEGYARLARLDLAGLLPRD